MSDDARRGPDHGQDGLSIVREPLSVDGSPSANGWRPVDKGDPDSLSPSLLWPTKTAASYELKFALPPLQAEQVEGWARHHLALDPHADAALGNAYLIRSVYFDTPRLDVYHQAESY